MTTPLIEAIARKQCDQHIRNVRRWDMDPAKLEAMLPAAIDYSWQDQLPAAQAALTAITEAGMVIVPREPTEAMLEAANLADRGMMPWGAQYRAMINAAQAPHIMPPPMRDSGPLESEEVE